MSIQLCAQGTRELKKSTNTFTKFIHGRRVCYHMGACNLHTIFVCRFVLQTSCSILNKCTSKTSDVCPHSLVVY